MSFHISYISRTNSKMSSEELEQLEAFASARNEQFEITGLLVYDGFHFFQYIEGPEENIKQLYKNISNDDRHDAVTELSSGPVEKRILPKWNMKSFLPGDFVAEDRVHIMNILEQKEQNPAIIETLQGLQAQAAAV